MIHCLGGGGGQQTTLKDNGIPVSGCVNKLKRKESRVACCKRAVVAKADMRRTEKRGEVS